MILQEVLQESVIIHMLKILNYTEEQENVVQRYIYKKNRKYTTN